MSCNKVLRYKISSWTQLSECKSNNNRDLKISVSEIKNNQLLIGLKISVIHPKFGALFTEILGAKGNLITYLNEDEGSNLSYELTPEQIISELYKFGFIVYYEPRKYLPDSMLTYLRTLQNLNFDKLRILYVCFKDNFDNLDSKPQVVGFQSGKNPRWLDNTHVASIAEFKDSLAKGYAVNITEFCNTLNFDWGWLDFVANIQDILDDNAKVGDIDGN